jgi:putative restriction endonuclease
MEYWNGRCPLTGIDQPELLRASHIKAWAACESDRERLDVHNGLLLAAHLDAAFDDDEQRRAAQGAYLFAQRAFTLGD